MAARAPETAVAVDRKKAPARGAPRKRPGSAGRENDAARVRRRFEQLLDAGLTIHQEHALPAVLQRIVDAAREVVGARYAALGVFDERGDALQEFVTSGVTPEDARRIGALPSGRGLLGLVIRERRPVRTANIRRHAASVGLPPHHPPMTTFLGVPIALRDRVFGNLYLTEKEGGGPFTVDDETIAVLLASQAAAAIDNARLHQEGRELLGQVQAMHRQRDLFFAMMNHELRNALTGVFGWAERLVRKRPGDPAQAAREVFEGAERTITLLNNFLDLTRLDAGKLRPVWRDVQVRTAVARAVAGLIPAAEPKQVSIEEQYVQEPHELRTDPMRLEQILVNLVSNAVRHSPPGRAVVIRVQGNANDTAFEVHDQGPGVPEDLREKIFEPFERFDPLSGTGSGLGLPLSRRLAEILGGRLSVETLGGATVFRLVLPLEPPADA
jgi:signal transduction histidine kinase